MKKWMIVLALTGIFVLRDMPNKLESVWMKTFVTKYGEVIPGHADWYQFDY
jgi:hypothetical protein